MDHQAEYVIVGIVVMLALAWFNYQWLEAFWWVLYGGIILALLATFTPLGSSALGAARWIQVGPVQVQPSAFGALVLIVLVAAYYGKKHMLDDVNNVPLAFNDLVKLLALAAVPILLVVKQLTGRSIDSYNTYKRQSNRSSYQDRIKPGQAMLFFSCKGWHRDVQVDANLVDKLTSPSRTLCASPLSSTLIAISMPSSKLSTRSATIKAADALSTTESR